METTPPKHDDRDHSDEAEHTDVVDDPRVSTVPLDTDDGGTVVIHQQNAGPGQQVGAGEFKEPGRASRHKRPEEAAAEEAALEREAPVDEG
jgi:hypothetical protein